MRQSASNGAEAAVQAEGEEEQPVRLPDGGKNMPGEQPSVQSIGLAILRLRLRAMAEGRRTTFGELIKEASEEARRAARERPQREAALRALRDARRKAGYWR